MEHIHSNEDFYLRFYDQYGKLNYELKFNLEKSVQYIFDVSEFNPGPYALQLLDKNGFIIGSEKFIKTGK